MPSLFCYMNDIHDIFNTAHGMIFNWMPFTYYYPVLQDKLNTLLKYLENPI